MHFKHLTHVQQIPLIKDSAIQTNTNEETDDAWSQDIAIIAA